MLDSDIFIDIIRNHRYFIFSRICKFLIWKHFRDFASLLLIIIYTGLAYFGRGDAVNGFSIKVQSETESHLRNR